MDVLTCSQTSALEGRRTDHCSKGRWYGCDEICTATRLQRATSAGSPAVKSTSIMAFCSPTVRPLLPTYCVCWLPTARTCSFCAPSAIAAASIKSLRALQSVLRRAHLSSNWYLCAFRQWQLPTPRQRASFVVRLFPTITTYPTRPDSCTP
jgi:hypothetical protein